MTENTGFKELSKQIKKCDIDSNGYLTSSELNTVFWQVYPKLEGRSMFKIFRSFGSIQNKNLIEYKKLIAYLKSRISQLPSKNLLDKEKNFLNVHLSENITNEKWQNTILEVSEWDQNLKYVNNLQDINYLEPSKALHNYKFWSRPEISNNKEEDNINLAELRLTSPNTKRMVKIK